MIHIVLIVVDLEYVAVSLCSLLSNKAIFEDIVFLPLFTCIYIYMFIYTESIEDAGRPPGLIFGM